MNHRNFRPEDINIVIGDSTAEAQTGDMQTPMRMEKM